MAMMVTVGEEVIMTDIGMDTGMIGVDIDIMMMATGN